MPSSRLSSNFHALPPWDTREALGSLSLCLPGDCRVLCLSSSWLTYATLLIVPSSHAGTHDRVSSQTPSKQDRGPPSLHFFLQSVSGLYHVLMSLEFQLQEKRVLSEAKRLASCLCFLYFLSALTQTQQHKTTDSFCGSAIQAQDSQMPLAQDPS